MATVIRLIDLGGFSDRDLSGQYVVEYDVHEKILDTSWDKDRAKVFPSIVEARDYVMVSDGIRPDGKPNRPITAYTMAFEGV